MIKTLIRELLMFLHLDVTKNLKYDRLTKHIIRKHLKPNYNCVDVGCHKGEILDLMLRHAPQGEHFAFEPIPYLYKDLQKKYQDKCHIYPYALSDQSGESSFQVVKNAPAYSGIKRRQYAISNPEIEEIKVEVRTLDEIIPEHIPIHLVKIDVEGGEFGVLRGGIKILKKHKPIIIFECGKGASDFYGTNPVELYRFITRELGLKIYTLASFGKQKKPMTENEFESCYDSVKEFYYVAA